MKKMKKIRLALLFIFFFVLGFQTKTKAQSEIVSAGGNTSGSGGSTCFSLGQVSYICCESANGSVSQGVQQTYVITVPNEVQTLSDVQSNIQLYPNPAETAIAIKINAQHAGNLHYRLRNISGQIIKSFPISKDITNIDLNGYASDVYILEIWADDTLIDSFKIIKQ